MENNKADNNHCNNTKVKNNYNKNNRKFGNNNMNWKYNPDGIPKLILHDSFTNVIETKSKLSDYLCKTYGKYGTFLELNKYYDIEVKAFEVKEIAKLNKQELFDYNNYQIEKLLETTDEVDIIKQKIFSYMLELLCEVGRNIIINDIVYKNKLLAERNDPLQLWSIIDKVYQIGYGYLTQRESNFMLLNKFHMIQMGNKESLISYKNRFQDLANKIREYVPSDVPSDNYMVDLFVNRLHQDRYGSIVEEMLRFYRISGNSLPNDIETMYNKICIEYDYNNYQNAYNNNFYCKHKNY